MTTPLTIQEWLNTAEGVAMNPDGHYGLQCVDLVDQYAQDIFEVPWPQCVGGVQGAKQLLDVTPDAYWIRTDNNPNDPNLIPSPGDVIVFGGSAINEWGHTCVCISADQNGMWVIQQDGFAAPLIWADGAWYSGKPAHKAWLPYWSNGTGHISGWLTPRTEKLAQQDPAPAPVAPSPAPVAGHQRITAHAVNQRAAANTTAPILKTFDADLILDFKGFVRGEAVDGNNIWFVGAYSDTYFHSSAFSDQGTHDLSDLTPAPPVPAPTPAPQPVPAPTPAPQPEPAKYSFSPDFDFVEVIPAGIGNFQSGNFPTDPAKAVIHQFGTPGIDTLSSVINTFNNPNSGRQVSAHFVVCEDRIIQMVSLKDRAYHAGSVGNNFIGIETDPAQSPATIASTRKLLAALNAKYGYTLPLIRHKDVQGNSTSCGTLIDLDKYKVDVPAPAPTPAPIDEAKVIGDFLDWLKNEYLNR